MAYAIAETLPARHERARLPGLLYLVMGCAAVAAIVALVAVVIPDGVKKVPIVPRHAPSVDQPRWPDTVHGHGAPKHIVRHDAPPDIATPPISPFSHAPSKRVNGGDAGSGANTSSSHVDQVNHNVQDSTDNANEATNVDVNHEVSSSSNKSVTSSGSVDVSNGTNQVAKSGAGTNSVHVRTSVHVSKTVKSHNSD